MVRPRSIKVWTAPSSNLTPEKLFIKIGGRGIGSKRNPIIACTVLVGTYLTRTDNEEDLRRIRIVQGGAPACFPSTIDLAGIFDAGYICSCGRHLAYRGNTPLPLCQILQLPDGVRFESQ
jgi:hypothetical protein